MISITVRPDKITVTGHSGYADPGKDIVCSAISVLVQNLIVSIEELTEDKMEYTLEAGSAAIKYEGLSENADLFRRSLLLGITGVAESYPDNVNIIREDAPKL